MADDTYGARKILTAFSKAYNELDYYAFVKSILNAEPREGDWWQEEKWDIFHAACQGILRLNEEHLRRILELYL